MSRATHEPQTSDAFESHRDKLGGVALEIHAMIRRRVVRRLFCLLLAVVLTVQARSSYAVDFTDELLSRVPVAANAVALVDVEGLFKSKLGVKQSWSRRYYTDYASGLVAFPPTVQTAVLAAKIDADSISAEWELGLVRLKQPFAMKKLAEKEAASLEKLEGHSFVASERRACFIELRPQTLAVTNHQNRQDVARWLRVTHDRPRPAMSDYLQEALTGSSAKGQYRLALDLQDVLHLDDVKLRLQNSPVLKNEKLDLEELAKLITGVRGLQIHVEVGETIEGSVQLDFSGETTPFARVLPKLALAAFEKNGVAIDELPDAKVKLGAKSLTFESTLSEISLRRIISFIQPSVGHLDDGSHVAESSPKSVEQAASIRFFAAVQTQLADLEKQARKAKDYTSSAHWFETAAKKISQLPSRDVDPELLNCSASVSTKLRAIARSLRGVPLDVGALQFEKKQESYVYPNNYYVSTPWTNYTVSYGAGYAYAQNRVEYRNNFTEIEAKQAKVIADAEKDRQKIWDMVIDETSVIRSRLSRKFETEF